MMDPPKLWLDEDVASAVAAILQSHLLDVDGVFGHPDLKGLTDEQQLQEATDRERVIVSHNSRDYVLLSRDWYERDRPHAGILLVPQRPPRAVAERVRLKLATWPASGFYNALHFA